MSVALDPSFSTALKTSNVSVMDITAWLREDFDKLLSLNIVSRCIYKCKLRLCSGRRISPVSRNAADFSGLKLNLSLSLK